jgi:hypothetical protein
MRIMLFLGLLAVVGCQAAPSPQTPTDIATPEAELSPTGEAPVAAPTLDPNAPAQAQPTAEPIATTIAIVRATAAPPPTLVPASEAVVSSATSLQTKLGAVRAALRTQDVGSALKAQRDLLTSADQADAALKNDKSTSAQTLRGAVADIRTAATSGDTNSLDHADAALRQVLGGGGSLGITANTPAVATPATTDLKSMQEQVRGLRQAIQNRNSGEALRTQGQLLIQLAAAQKAAADDDSEDGKALRAALSDLQKGLDGDATRLASAATALDKLGGPVDQPAVASDVPRVAASLGAKIDAFRAAASTGSRGDVLKLQQDILTEADQATTALVTDKSPPADAIRDALKDVRAGVSGDLSKLDGARSALARVAGQDAPTSATQPSAAAPSNKPIADLARFSSDLDNTVSAFQTALQKNDTASMLRLQRQLSDLASQADTSLREANSKPAEEVRAAVASIRTAFAGDLTKLDEAHLHLRSVSGTTSQARVAPTNAPTVTTATSATSATSATTASNATAAPAAPPAPPAPTAVPPNVPAVANGLRDRVTGLSTAVRDRQSDDEISRRREALKAEVDRASAALNGSTDPRADRLRAALGAAREAAGGDDTKVANAQAALENALAGQ